MGILLFVEASDTFPALVQPFIKLKNAVIPKITIISSLRSMQLKESGKKHFTQLISKFSKELSPMLVTTRIGRKNLIQIYCSIVCKLAALDFVVVGCYDYRERRDDYTKDGSVFKTRNFLQIYRFITFQLRIVTALQEFD